jgi:2-hydroxy-3-keto-5-methylthiopentenyl-1-phosphate phosphatase
MLHHATLGAAVKKYGPLHNEGLSEEAIKEAIAGDEKEFNADAVNEIYAAITAEVGAAKGHVALTEFRDRDNFDLIYKAGDDVSHFDEARKADLVERGLIEAV